MARDTLLVGAGVQRGRSFKRRIAKTVGARYLLYLPAEYNPKGSDRWPLILFLHGAGERGSHPDRVKRQGIPKMLEERDDFPFVVVSPQCPQGEDWDADILGALLDEVEEKLTVDPDRFYVTGFSMGGVGTWDLAIAYPHRLAAIAPVCAGHSTHPAQVKAIAHLPVWVFHGARDVDVPPRRSEDMVKRLKRCGGNVRFTLYPEANHDAWTPAYADPELYLWFLEHTRR